MTRLSLCLSFAAVDSLGMNRREHGLVCVLLFFGDTLFVMMFLAVMSMTFPYIYVLLKMDVLAWLSLICLVYSDQY